MTPTSPRSLRRCSQAASPWLVIYENRWALGLVDAWRRDGARLIASGGFPADELVAALDAAESS